MVCFVEKEAEIGEDDPELLPAIAIFELAKQIATQLVLNTNNTLYNIQILFLSRMPLIK